MKKLFKIIIIFIILIIIALGIMFAFKICPPQGPWIMPPWCHTEIESGQATQATFWVTLPSKLADSQVNLVIANHQPLAMKKVGTFSYQTKVSVTGQEKLNYSYQVNSHNFTGYQITITQPQQKIYDAIAEQLDFKPTLGINMMDTWGKNYNFMMLENTRNNIDSSMQRVANLGAHDVFVTDFHRIIYNTGDFSLTNTDYTIEPEIFSNDFRDEMMTQQDLNKLVQSAHDNNLKIGWRTSLHFWDIGKYVGQDNISEMLAQDFAEFYKPKNEVWLKDFLKKYKEFMLTKAEMLNQAGFDYMILTPGYMTPSYEPYGELADGLWQDIIQAVKQKFNGQVAVEIHEYSLLDGADDQHWWQQHDYYHQADILFHYFVDLPNNYQAQGTDYQSLITALEKYYHQLDRVAKQHHIRLSEIARFPSYLDSINQDYETNDIKNPAIQALKTDWQYQAEAYEAWFMVMRQLTQFDRAILSGYWWDNAMDPVNAKTFISKSGSARNKPAEAVIKKWGKAIK